ncbi:hypothetical protein [Bartonella sp. C271]|uniref:hypothetical protein n=1 Tax=Bartonella sp. C271 TaxID=3070220 RepID=UPI0038B53F14
MAIILIFGSLKLVIKIGYVASQFEKPRFSDMKEKVQRSYHFIKEISLMGVKRI